MRPVLLVVGAAILLAAGVVHGLWTDRWQPSAAPAAFAARLPDVPQTLGEWDARSVQLDPQKIEMAQVSGYLARAYAHRRDGTVLTLLLLAGRSGPVAVHPPDVCYAGTGFAVVSGPSRCRVDDAELWTARFRKGDAAAPVNLRIFWAWSAAGEWQAPANARWTFARYPALYKLYVIQQTPTPDDAPEQGPCVEFLRLLLPELQHSLFSDRPAGAEAAMERSHTDG